jgi:peptidoglycan hydrolase CwlO-like protein
VETLTEENAALESEKKNFIANVNKYTSQISCLTKLNRELEGHILELSTQLKRAKDSKIAENNKLKLTLEEERTKSFKLESQMQGMLEDLQKSDDERRGSVKKQFEGKSTGPQIDPVSPTKEGSGTFQMVVS